MECVLVVVFETEWSAFDAVSTLTLKPFNSRLSLIDLRNVELPFTRPDNDFDPRSHRTPKVIIRPWMAYINVLRAAVGLGMLGAPLATSQAGLLFGPFLITFIGCLLIHTHLMLLADWRDSSTSLMYMFLPVFVLELLTKDLRIISYIINGANAMNFCALTIVVVQIFRGPRRETQLFPRGWVALLVAVGTFMFNMSAVGVILSCEKALQDPHVMSKRFGVVRVGLIVPTCVTILIGTLGFWAYGVMDENILRYLAYDDPVSMAAFGLFSASSCLAYPLACYPGYQIILEVIKNHDPFVELEEKSLKMIEFVSRPVFVLMTFFIAYCLPFQGPFVAFVGSLCTTLLSLVYPALMEIGLCYPDYYGRFNYILLKDLLIVVMGMVIWSGGIVLCGYLLYVRIQSSNDEIDEL